MRLAVALWTLVAAAILGSWWWLGRAVPMPASPFAAAEKLHCVSYTPFRDGQTPLDASTRIDPAAIEDDFARLALVTDCVRTYSTDLGLDRVAEIAGRHDLTVIQGLWLGREPERNRREIETVVGLARQYPTVIRAIIVGNEVLLRGELSATAIAAIVRRVKQEVAVPVTYADVWEFWLRNRELADAVDFVTIHILPYWEDVPIPAERAAAHVARIRAVAAQAFAGKDILIGEVGWPSAGRMREGALPSPVEQARVLHDVIALAKRDGFDVNIIEAFDQPWKRQLEGTVGGYWGLFDADYRVAKFAWGRPVTNHPHWLVQAMAGMEFAAAIFLVAGFAGRAKPLDGTSKPARWFAIAVLALPAGMLIGLAAEDAAIQSFGFGDWVRSFAMLAIAIAAPIGGAAALVRRIPVPAFACVLARGHRPPAGRLAYGLGLLLVVLTVVALQVALGLVFDPRYRDFPFAALGAGLAPFLILAQTQERRAGPRGVAETVMAVLLGASAAYIVFNEGFANWQALCLAAVLAGLTMTLLRSRDAPG